jgi:hypothetical protein
MSEQEEKSGVEEQIEEKIAEAVSSAEGVQEEVKKIVLGAFEAGEASIKRLLGLTQDALSAAAGSLESVADEDRSKRLEATVAGLGDALSSALNAAGLAFEEAKSKGEKFASEDVKKAVDELKEIESLLVDSVSKLAESSSGAAKQSAEDLLEHAKRITDQLRPNLESTLASLTSQPLELAQEATSLVAGVLGGALQGAAEALKKAAEKKE